MLERFVARLGRQVSHSWEFGRATRFPRLSDLLSNVPFLLR